MVKKNIPHFEKFEKQEPTNVIKQVRTYQLITPLFGGGVNPGEVDMITPIRGSEIRGHLRFWWRACRGGQFGKDLQKLKEEEDKIWGKAHKNDEDAPKYDTLVHISVKNSDIEPTLVAPFKIEPATNKKGQPVYKENGQPEYQPKSDKASGVPPYAAFPLQPQKEDLDQNPPPELKKVGIDIAFKLEIYFPENRRKDVEAALWAWETFGGIGARTRRGFGAIRLIGVNGEPNTNVPSIHTPDGIKELILKNLKHFIGTHNDFHDQVPHLSLNPQLKVLGPFEDPERACGKAWQELIDELARFRQSKGRDKNKRWPDSKEARAIVEGDKSDKPHPFPKAVLGLPIVFHLSDDCSPSLQHKTKGQERLASPIILRPLAFQDNLAFGVALLLQGNYVLSEDLALVADNDNHQPFDAAITTALPDDTVIPILNGEKDVLQAFMNSLGKSDGKRSSNYNQQRNNNRPNNYNRQRNNNRPYNKQRPQNRGGDNRWNRD